jgi:hypothetical protein
MEITMKKMIIASILIALSISTMADGEYYLEYNTPGQKLSTTWGPMKTLQECQEEMAKFLGRFGDKIINPRCVKK